MTRLSHHGERKADPVHENSWSANLETDEYAADRDLVVADALDAIRRTAPGYHVNLVTHSSHGTPEGYLLDPIRESYPAATCEYVSQCGCGGHVLRVHV
jgi:putative CGCGG family rSAM target protein